MGRPLIAVPIGIPQCIKSMPIGASEVFKNRSGHLVKPDGSGRMEIAGDASVNIVGWMLQGERTASATEGADKGDVILDHDMVYLMPACGAAGIAVSEAVLKAATGKSCDIYVGSDYQYANVAASVVGILLIVGYEYYGSAVGDQWARVKINWEKVVNTGV